MMEHDKLSKLLNVVIENYIFKGDPIGSKFLHNVEGMDYAPSTLRKYLNMLEKAWLVYQPYNSSWRIPTIQGFSQYVTEIMEGVSEPVSDIEFDLDYTRNGLRYVVETLGTHVDGVVVGFLKNDEYFFLWINNILKDSSVEEYETTKKIIEFIEQKKIVHILDQKMVKQNKIYYTFIAEGEESAMSCLYTKLHINGYDSLVCVLGPLRVNYKKNLGILKKFLSNFIW